MTRIEPCKRCGHSRRVRVRDPSAVARPHCNACEYEIAAVNHDHGARVARERAKALRAKLRPTDGCGCALCTQKRAQAAVDRYCIPGTFMGRRT